MLRSFEHIPKIPHLIEMSHFTCRRWRRPTSFHPCSEKCTQG